ncbi:hypothetical protein ACP70R_010063 [Stipagrostis hirtigluma subsp. patula]
MEAQAAPASNKEPRGQSREEKEKEQVVDAFCRGAAERGEEKAAERKEKAAEESGGAKPLPHEQVPQPADVYNEQLERL